MTTLNLNETEFDIYYSRYINKLSNKINLRQGFEIGKHTIIQFFKSIPKDKLNYHYAPEKWSVKEVFSASYRYRANIYVPVFSYCKK